MRKYILTVCTFLVHNFITTPKTVNPTHELKEEENQQKKQIESKYENNFEDSTLTFFVRKGGLHSATWYNAHGRRTASGEKFHKDSLTAAYNFSKMHTYLKVTNVKTNEFVIVRVTDRMGVKSKNHIDLSRCAFDSIANLDSGRIKVTVEEIVTKN